MVMTTRIRAVESRKYEEKVEIKKKKKKCLGLVLQLFLLLFFFQFLRWNKKYKNILRSDCCFYILSHEMMTFDELEMTRGQHKKKLGYTQTIAVVLQTFSLFSPFCFISETELMLSAANSSQTQTRAREENELPQRLFASQRLSAFHTDDECDQKTSPATCGTCKSFLFFFFF